MKFLKNFFAKRAAEAARLREREQARRALQADLDDCNLQILYIEIELAKMRIEALLGRKI